MRAAFLSFILSLFAFVTVAQSSNLTVTFKNVLEPKGQLMVFLGDENGKYLDGFKVPVKKAGDVELKIPDLTAGKYILKVFHDLNGDEELNTNMVGMPKEPYGFSNDARGSFGPPEVADQVFTVKADTRITITLN